MQKPTLGVGFYTFPEAARLLKTDSGALHRWVQGYRFSLTPGKVRRKEPVVPASLPQLENITLLSFVDLIELRVVRALLDTGMSLQGVRRARELAYKHHPVEHPFASRRLYTPRSGSRKSVFFEIMSEPHRHDFVELTRRAYLQIQPGELVDEFLAEVDFSTRSVLAHRWWPLGRAFPVVLDPRIAFGAPVVADSGVKTVVVAGLARRTDVADAADAFALSVESAEAAVRFEETLAAA